jgi:hypothetical protein
MKPPNLDSVVEFLLQWRLQVIIWLLIDSAIQIGPKLLQEP